MNISLASNKTLMLIAHSSALSYVTLNQQKTVQIVCVVLLTTLDLVTHTKVINHHIKKTPLAPGEADNYYN